MRYGFSMSLSKAAADLGFVLDEGGEHARRLKTERRDGQEGIHYTQLWRYRTGKSRPTVELAAWMEHVTDGRVKAADWACPANTNDAEDGAA